MARGTAASTLALAIARFENTATISATTPRAGTSATYANVWPNSQISFGSTVSPSRKKSKEPENRRSRSTRPSPTAAMGASTIVSHDQTYTDQAKIGVLGHVRAGARWRRMVSTRLIAEPSCETTRRITPISQSLTPLPSCERARGGSPSSPPARPRRRRTRRGRPRIPRTRRARRRSPRGPAWRSGVLRSSEG